jgi:sialate O-acetylesterase
MLKRISILWVGLVATQCFAELTLPSIISNGMVIQQNEDFVVWGWTDNSGSVQIRPSWMENATAATVRSDGKWLATIAPPPAGGTYEIAIEAGDDRIDLQDILCGEVWLCSGQSNMDMGLKYSKDGAAAVREATFPEIRLFHIPRASSLRKETSVDAKWKACTPTSIQEGVWGGFSAVGYYFAKNLHETLGVPVGIIKSAYGGSCIETWIPTEACSSDEKLAPLYRKKKLAEDPNWSPHGLCVRVAAAQPAEEANPDTPHGRYEVTGLYNAMIHPIVPFNIRGVIWYQGEQNIHWFEGPLYYNKMAALIEGWRTAWNKPDLPFYYVQIAPFDGYNGTYGRPRLCEAQRLAMKLPNVGMVVTSDIGNVDDIHPKEKKTVADRLFLWAKSKVYGFDNVVVSGPIYKSKHIEGNTVVLSFDYVGGGLKTSDGNPPSCFEIAGSDGNFVEATAEIVGDTIVVRSAAVPHPVNVRFAWSDAALHNLVNEEGLPASLFTTDAAAFELPAGENIAFEKPVTTDHPNPFSWKEEHLTDGNWSPVSKFCFATDSSESFPKNVVVDLGTTSRIHAVRLGTPNVGSTKTVAISTSNDGNLYTEVGRVLFKQGFCDIRTVEFNPINARYVKLTFLNQYDKKIKHSPNYAFITELEVYSCN